MHQVYISWTENIIFPPICMDFSLPRYAERLMLSDSRKVVVKLQTCVKCDQKHVETIVLCCGSAFILNWKLKFLKVQNVKEVSKEFYMPIFHLSCMYVFCVHFLLLSTFPSWIVRLLNVNVLNIATNIFEPIQIGWCFSMMNLKIQSSFANKHYKKQYNLPGSFRLTNTLTFKSSHHFG